MLEHQACNNSVDYLYRTCTLSQTLYFAYSVHITGLVDNIRLCCALLPHKGSRHQPCKAAERTWSWGSVVSRSSLLEGLLLDRRHGQCLSHLHQSVSWSNYIHSKYVTLCYLPHHSHVGIPYMPTDNVLEYNCSQWKYQKDPIPQRVMYLRPNVHTPSTRTRQDCLVLFCRWCEQNWRQVKTVLSSVQYIGDWTVLSAV